MRLRIEPSERIGVIGINNYGSKMIVEEYITPLDIWVKFNETGTKIHTTWRNFLIGNVKDVYDKSVFNVGFLGEGKFTVTENGKYTPQYISWNRMIQRCYDEKLKNRLPTYNNCSVVEEWHNFQTFAAWYDDNYYEIEGERMALDKDILIKGNKVYSPNTCTFVSDRINSLFVKGNSKRGEFPIGVSFHKKRNKYQALCSNGKGKQNFIGEFNTIDEAFNAYKKRKEKVIKEIAEKYKHKIPEKLYRAMIDYTVEVTD